MHLCQIIRHLSKPGLAKLPVAVVAISLAAASLGESFGLEQSLLPQDREEWARTAISAGIGENADLFDLDAPTAGPTACGAIAGYAEVVMAARQGGYSMSEFMDRESDEMLRKLIIQAYSRERHDSYDSQDVEIADFQNDYYLACIKSFV